MLKPSDVGRLELSNFEGEKNRQDDTVRPLAMP